MRVILISTSSKTRSLLKEILLGPQLEAIDGVTGILEGKKKLREKQYDLVIIQAPAADEFGTRGAIEIANSFHVGVILMVKQDTYDQVLYQTMDSDVFTIGLPTTSQNLYQCIQFCMKHRRRMLQLENDLAKQKKKLQDEKMIHRAKLFLMEQKHLTEEEAHHMIESRAMSSSRTKVSIAREILE